jgi:hypothetical protein
MSNDAIEGDDDQHERLEMTIGVMVPFDRQPDGTYRMRLDELVTTDGGLFSDASNGAWCPACSEWVDTPGSVPSRAEDTVRRALGNVTGR